MLRPPNQTQNSPSRFIFSGAKQCVTNRMLLRLEKNCSLYQKVCYMGKAMSVDRCLDTHLLRFFLVLCNVSIFMKTKHFRVGNEWQIPDVIHVWLVISLDRRVISTTVREPTKKEPNETHLVSNRWFTSSKIPVSKRISALGPSIDATDVRGVFCAFTLDTKNSLIMRLE